ncbi:MAG: aspartate/glutamate racemase family protein [Lachnospiraceae bacterium]|nr:aspartate/glutamate racemase family protein [Lachnospiraceae bacterium]
MKDNFVIGVLGGMGTYATIQLFKQYAQVFPAEKEWDRPRIVIDNRCTMPSRVLAYLHHEKEEELIEQMSDSMQHLVDAGASRIILACNTSHLFLPRIYERVPELESRVIHIIRTCVDHIKKDGQKQVYLLGSEGTIDSRIYQDALAAEGIECLVPAPEEYADLRTCIEAVKQDKYTDEAKRLFLELVNRYDACILGCTELPILYEKYAGEITCARIYDPLFIALGELKAEYDAM